MSPARSRGSRRGRAPACRSACEPRSPRSATSSRGSSAGSRIPNRDCVVDVVVDVGDPVDDPHDLAFERRRLLRTGVGEDPVSNLFRQVQRLGDTQRLLVVTEALAETLLQRRVECLLSGMAERRMPHVVAEPDRLDEVFVESQCTRDDARDRGRLERVRHPRAVVVAGRIDEDLRLALQAPKGLRMQDPVAIALERGAQTAIVLAPRGVVPRVSYERTASGEASALFLLAQPAPRTHPRLFLPVQASRSRLDDDRDGSAVRAPGGTCHVGSTLRAQKCRSPKRSPAGSASRPSGRPAPTASSTC